MNGGGTHRRTAAAFLLVSVLAGLLAGAFSLLFRLPPGRLPLSSDTIRLLADGHAPLILLGCALPALLGGMGLLLVPDAVGVRDTAFPSLSATSAVLVAAGTVLFASALVAGHPVLLLFGLACWTVGLVGCASDLMATILHHRAPPAAVPHRAVLSPFVRAVAVACPLAIASLPVLPGRALHLHPGPELLAALSGPLCWPVLTLLLVLLLGLVADVLLGGVVPGDVPPGELPPGDAPARAALVSSCGWILAAAAAAAFLCWCEPMLGHGRLRPAPLRALLLCPAVLVLLPSAVAAIRGRFLFRLSRGPELHAAGFLAVAVISAVWFLAAGGHFPAHYALSAGAAFGLLAGLHRWLDRAAPRAVPPSLARCQFALLFAGIHLMLLPGAGPTALGAACCAVSLVILAAMLLFCCRRAAPDRPHARGYAVR